MFLMILWSYVYLEAVHHCLYVNICFHNISAFWLFCHTLLTLHRHTVVTDAQLLIWSSHNDHNPSRIWYNSTPNNEPSFVGAVQISSGWRVESPFWLVSTSWRLLRPSTLCETGSVSKPRCGPATGGNRHVCIWKLGALQRITQKSLSPSLTLGCLVYPETANTRNCMCLVEEHDGDCFLFQQ
jgi:hypothetical protein